MLSLTRAGSMQPALLFGVFEDESGYALNLRNPSGVRFLTRPAVDRLRALYVDEDHVPNLQPESVRPGSIEAQLVMHGLASTGQALASRPKPAKALSVWLHIVNACNIACRYCYIPGLQKAALPESVAKYTMTVETAERVVRSLIEHCSQQAIEQLQLKFAGGEPTLALDLIDHICSLAKRLGEEHQIKVGFRILTNGVFDPRLTVPVLARHRIGTSISLDGPRLPHDAIRFVSKGRSLPGSEVAQARTGTWDHILGSVRALLDHGVRPYILSTLTPGNIKHVKELTDFCVGQRLGFRLSPVRDSSSHQRPGVLSDYIGELTALYENLGHALPVDMPLERFARFAEWNLKRPKQIACGTCSGMLAVDQTGKASSCQMRLDSPLGDISVESTSDVWRKIRSHPDNEFLVHPERKTRECTTCAWQRTCAGGCPEHTRMAEGTTNAPSPWCDLYYALFPVYVRSVARQMKRRLETTMASATP